MEFRMYMTKMTIKLTMSYEVSEAELTFPDITYTKVIRLKETKPLDVYPHIKK